MNLQYRISKKAHLVDGLALHEVMARLHSGSTDLYAKTGVFVPVHYTDRNGNRKTTWKDGSIVIPRISYSDDAQVKLKKLLEDAKVRLVDIESRVGEAYEQLIIHKRKPAKDWLQHVINGETEIKRQDQDTLVAIYDRYVHDSRLHVSDTTRQQYASLVNNIKRYESYRDVTLYLDSITPDTLNDFYNFMLSDLDNAMNSAARRLKRLRSFIRWANGLSKDWPIAPLTRNNPFDLYRIPDEQYGTPFYLTIDELNRLLAFDFVEPRLARQRDIFVFHCLIGCRISDLWSRTKDSVIDGAIEYIPRKTKDGRPITVRVPLNSKAKAILARYIDNGDPRLFPFVAQQQYNEDIKEILKLAGITRMVTILDPKTRQEVKRPINEVATSHMARRTFIGNLYKHVKDPNLIGKLSGHAEGSKAFARYRDIDEDMAKELVSMLE